MPAGGAGSMVALGDSFSAGEGAPQVLSVRKAVPGAARGGGPTVVWGQNDYFYDGTDHTGNRCHRSPMAYAPLVATKLGLTLDFRACSGAKVPDFYFRQSGREGERELGQQMGRWPGNVRLVTVGFGGNDMGFGDVVQSCLMNSYLKDYVELRRKLTLGLPGLKTKCGAKVDEILQATEENDTKPGIRDANKKSRPAYYYPADLTPADQQKRDVDGNAMGETLADALMIAHDKAPDARIIVVSYPLMFPKEPTRRCGIGSGTGAKLSVYDQKQINKLVTEINRRTKKSAELAGADFVDMTDAFADRGMCKDDGNLRWVNRMQFGKPVNPGGATVDPQKYFPNLRESIHPNTGGQEEYARRVLECFNNRAVCSAVNWKKLAFDEAECFPRDEFPDKVYDDYLDAVEVTWHDFTGDGEPEAVVKMQCPSSTSSWATEVMVYSAARPGHVGADIIARLPDTAPAKGWLLNADVKVDGNTITVEGVAVTPGHTPAEPAHWLSQTYHWQPEKFLLDEESLVAVGWKRERDRPKPGIYYGLFKQLDGQDLTIDQVAWFTGADAEAACREDGAEFIGPWCSDYYYRNQTELITMGTVKRTAPVTYYDDDLKLVTTTGADLSGLRDRGGVGDGASIFKFTLDGDTITAIKEMSLS